MPANQRFSDSTRGRIAALLRCGEWTVEDLARELGLTDNAVRAHLATLERDGLAVTTGARRPPGAGKPATLYGMPSEGDVLFSRAYPPVLAAVIAEVAARVPPQDQAAFAVAVGRRLAASLPHGRGTTHRIERLRAAAAMLEELGGNAELVEEGGRTVIRGCGCPLGAAVRAHPATCRIVEALLSEVIGGPVTERCDRGVRPSCRFEVPEAG